VAGGAGGRDEGRLVKRGPLLAGLAVLALAGGLVAYHRLGGPRLPAPPGPGELQRLRRERQGKGGQGTSGEAPARIAGPAAG